jgi:hypothetical protein
MATSAAPIHFERLGISIVMVAADADTGVAPLTATTIQIIGGDSMAHGTDRHDSLRIFLPPFVRIPDRLRASGSVTHGFEARDPTPSPHYCLPALFAVAGLGGIEGVATPRLSATAWQVHSHGDSGCYTIYFLLH